MSSELPLEIGPAELDRMRRDGAAVAVLDVREPWEVEICALADSLRIPLAEVPKAAAGLPAEGTVVVICHHGARSLRATLWLRQQGHANTVNLRGGIDAWASEIDPSMRRY